ncbi:transfer RNA nucleotidyltransferase [Auriculariales sp. MPI-PUGE-AT-0066]|nr:transfer RNA nucleotidyltransferase [Auriculariales sp. MPI-PUGE-AT-0066]
MGWPFVLEFQKFLQERNIDASHVYKVDQNAEKSKHLEPGGITIFGQKIEFVNLRSEEYAADSRVPTIEFGTPVQDALRRDATINALFYNIHTRSVEDLTDKGIPDLQAGLIRTPLPARETFLDDPLRVLRCIRFSAKFGFDIDPDVKKSALDPVIQDAIIAKVSRERVGVEIEKMLTGRDPSAAMSHIHDMSLYDVVFNVPSTVVLTPRPTSTDSGLVATILFQNIVSGTLPESLTKIHPTLLAHVDENKAARGRLFMGAALTPFAGTSYPQKNSTKPRKQGAEVAIREGLKLGTQGHYLDGVPVLFEAAAMLKQPVLEKWASRSERVAMGIMLRHKNVHNPLTGTFWQSSLLFSLLQELVAVYDLDKAELDVPRANALIELYNALVARIEELDLPSTLDAKPLLDGKALCRIFDKKPGPWVSGVASKVLEWQLDHPDASPAECETWLAEEWRAGRIELTEPPKRLNDGEASSSKKQKQR